MKRYHAPPELKPLIMELAQLAEWTANTNLRVAALWAQIEPHLNEMGGPISIDPTTQEKSGEIIIVCDDLEIGRTVSNYGSKVNEEELDKNLSILVREGILSQEEKDSIVKKKEVISFEYKVDQTELLALATENEDIRRAVEKATNPPDPRPAKVNVRKAKPDNVRAATTYFDAKVN